MNSSATLDQICFQTPITRKWVNREIVQLGLFDLTELEILSVVKKLENKNSTDNISMKIIKRHITNIVKQICYIITFPDSLKVSFVKPFHKKGDKNEF